jgi:hypothetical protein
MSILSEIGAFMAQKHNDLIEMINGKASKSSTEDIEITDSTKGIILNSPAGKRFRITVNDDGNLVKQEVDGDNNGIGEMTIGDDFIIQ